MLRCVLRSWPVVVFLLGACAAGAHADDGANLVGNGDFARAVADGAPAQWNARGDARCVTQSLQIVRDEAGKPFARLTCTKCEHSNPAAHAMLAQEGVVRLKKGQAYEFSCRARANGLLSRTVSVAISDMRVWENCGLSFEMNVADEWKTFKNVFVATRDAQTTARLQIWFTEPGQFDVADVKIVPCAIAETELTNVIPPAGGKNLIPNSSFEAGGAGWSSFGAGVGWGDLDCLHGQVQRGGGGAAQGEAFLRIPLGGQRTPVLYFDYYEPVMRRELSPLAGHKGWIRVDTQSTYTLSCFMRASEDGTPAALGVKLRDATGGVNDHRVKLSLTREWKRYAITFKPWKRYLFAFAGPCLDHDANVDVDLDAMQLEKSEQATAFEPRRNVEWTLEPTEPAGIFPAGKPPALRLRACNHGAAAAELKVTFLAADYAGQAASLADVAAELPAHSGIERVVALPADWRGYYRITAAGGADQADVRIAIVPAATNADSVCGINHAFATSRLIQLAKFAGVRQYRDWTLKWQHIEPRPGEYHWEIGDQQIDRVLREGVSVLPLLPPFPSADWSSEAPPGMPSQGYPAARYRQAFAPKDSSQLADFIARAVGRYKDRVHVWDFLNEPLYTDYALSNALAAKYGGRRYTAADYASLLHVAAAAMRKADPNCKVLGGIGSGPKHLTRELIDAGALADMDYLNLHIYPGRRAPETFAGDMDDLLKMTDARGGRKPVWITEFSYYGTDDPPRKPFLPGGHSWAEPRLLADERQCADYTLRFVAVMLSRGVQRIFFHAGGNGKLNQPEYECALMAEGGAPTKLFAAMPVFCELMGPCPKFIGQRQIGPGGWCLEFQTERGRVAVLWQDESARPQDLQLADEPRTTWIDAMGRPLADRPRRLSSSPVYRVIQSGG